MLACAPCKRMLMSVYATHAHTYTHCVLPPLHPCNTTPTPRMAQLLQQQSSASRRRTRMGPRPMAAYAPSLSAPMEALKQQFFLMINQPMDSGSSTGEEEQRRCVGWPACPCSMLPR